MEMETAEKPSNGSVEGEKYQYGSHHITESAESETRSGSPWTSCTFSLSLQQQPPNHRQLLVVLQEKGFSFKMLPTEPLLQFVACDPDSSALLLFRP